MLADKRKRASLVGSCDCNQGLDFLGTMLHEFSCNKPASAVTDKCNIFPRKRPPCKFYNFLKFFNCRVYRSDRPSLAPAYKIKPVISQGSPEIIYFIRYVPDGYTPAKGVLMGLDRSRLHGCKYFHGDIFAKDSCFKRVEPEIFVHSEPVDKDYNRLMRIALVDGYI